MIDKKDIDRNELRSHTDPQPAGLTDPDLSPEAGADLDFLKSQFRQDGLQVPAALSAESIRQALKDQPQSEVSASASAESAKPAADESGTSAPAPGTAGGFRRFRSRRWRTLVAAAACAMLVIALIPAVQVVLQQGAGDSGTITAPDGSGAFDGSGETVEPVPMTADSNGLYQFKSYDELDQQMHALLPEQTYDDTGNYYVTEEYTADAVPESIGDAESADSPAFAGNSEAASPKSDAQTYGSGSGKDAEKPAASSANSDESVSDGSAASANSSGQQHSSTYTQEEDVDEADIVKTDGKYIYYLSSIENQIIIAKASNGKAKRVSAVGGSPSGSFINDIYIAGDKLVVIGDDAGMQDTREKGGWTEATAVTVYDITDRKNPKRTASYTQTGSLLSSRLIGNSLCLVTNDFVYRYVSGRSLPYVSFNEDTPQKLPIGGISCIPETQSPSYTVIGMMDLSSGKASRDSVRTKAVLGGSEEIYCSGQNLYVAGQLMTGQSMDGQSMDRQLMDGAGDFDEYGYWQQRTRILKVSLSKGKVKYKAYADVIGSVNDQFSMDEHDGTFRVATTSDHNGEDVNNLFILDRKMKLMGSVIGFARDEHIEAVRYIRDKAYVITYEQTDPLFIIDLADPKNPVIEGHVKISGFSTLLVPVDAENLLGLGFSTESTEFGEATNGVKLALFDIRDPSHPKVADSKPFPNMSSPVQYDHKALLVGPDAAYYAIPYELEPDWETLMDAEIIDDADADYTYGILVFSAKAGKLKVLKDLNTKASVNRCIFIGDYIYGICSDDIIEGFHMQ